MRNHFDVKDISLAAPLNSRMKALASSSSPAASALYWGAMMG